ncbi:MAG: hypothetical protein GY898_05840 [Proteobacteria bacterium]|nr:hypothetical protein [Pseudomonadota bacterium]
MRLFVFAALTLLPTLAFAGGDHENHMQEVEEGDFRIDFSDQHCQEEFVMVKASIRNDGSDYLIVRKEEAVFEVADKKVQPYDGEKKKPRIIKLRSKKNHTYKVKADSGYHVDEFTLQLGGYYTAAAEGEPLEAPDFQLPASRNDFKAGPFSCKLTGLKQETKETAASFSCTYNGESVGFIDSALLGVRIEGGQEFANDDRKASKKLMEPGSKHSFKAVFHIEYKITDMQFATMNIVWRDTFSESKLEEVDMGEVDFELDEAKTAEKND